MGDSPLQSLKKIGSEAVLLRNHLTKDAFSGLAQGSHRPPARDQFGPRRTRRNLVATTAKREVPLVGRGRVPVTMPVISARVLLHFVPLSFLTLSSVLAVFRLLIARLLAPFRYST